MDIKVGVTYWALAHKHTLDLSSFNNEIIYCLIQGEVIEMDSMRAVLKDADGDLFEAVLERMYNTFSEAITSLMDEASSNKSH